MMPRVAHLITDLDIGGAELMLVKLLGALEPAGQHCVLCMSGAAPLAARLQDLGVPVASLGLTRGRPDPRGAWRAVRSLRRFQPHVLQTWMYHADLLGTLLRPWVGRPALVWNLRCADMDLTHYARLTGVVRSALARLSAMPAAVIVNSEAGRAAHLRYGYRPRRWAVIGNGFDCASFQPSGALRAALRRRLGVADGQPLIGMVARRDPAKDHACLLDAAVQVVALRPNVVFYLVGAGVPGLAAAVAARGLRDHVLLEEVRDDLAEIYPGLDLLVLSSAFGEGFPNVLGEAMACAVPCVSTDVGDARQIIGDSGLVVPRSDPRRLADAVLQALDWPASERAARGAQARAHIERNFGLEQVAERYRRLYQELAAGRAASSSLTA